MSTGTRRTLEVRRLGRLPFAESLSLQQRLVEDRQQGLTGDLLLLVEHPHVLTLGVRAENSRRHILASSDELAARGVAVFETGRGGDVTYHGPGQVVGYPIIDLKPDRCDVHRYVRDIEETLIRSVREFGVEAARAGGLTGVWVGESKLAAIGVRISRWVTSHGFALNVTTNLDYFRLIVPCGVVGRGVTSLEQVTGRRMSQVEVENAVVTHFCKIFDRIPIPLPLNNLSLQPQLE